MADKTENMVERSLPFITVLYGYAAMLVVFGHSHPLHTEWPEALKSAVAFVYIFHMPLFFLISGVLIWWTRADRNIMEWWAKKAKKLLIPYVSLSALAVIPKVLLGAYMSDNMEISMGNIIRILLIPRENIWGHFWFIPVFLAVQMGGAWICRLLEKLEVKKWEPFLEFGGGYFNPGTGHFSYPGGMVWNRGYL